MKRKSDWAICLSRAWEYLKTFQQALLSQIDQAKIKLGFFYAIGLGTQPDHWQALSYYDSVAEKGDLNAAYNAGVLAHTSLDPTTHRRAVKYYRLAAEAGDAFAQNNLGVLFENGQKVQQEYQQAFQWYKTAADDGNCAAQFNVGRIYQWGIGIPQD